MTQNRIYPINEVMIEDYVFRVSDLATGTSARYRVNAGGNLKILPEEN